MAAFAIGAWLNGALSPCRRAGLGTSVAVLPGAHLEQRAAAAPVLVCLDDLHWASPATLAALRALPRDLRRHPVAWLLARSSTPHRDVDYLFGLLEQDGAAPGHAGPAG